MRAAVTNPESNANRMSEDRELPTLRIYVVEHCLICAEARRLAEEVRERFAEVCLAVIDLDAEGSQNLDDVFSVPTYVLNGKILSLGNPEPEELFSRLTQALA